MNKYHIFLIIGGIVTSTFIMNLETEYISNESILGFLTTSPTLIGILLASVITSLAIIFAVMGDNELIKIKELENTNNKTHFIKISKNLRQDVYFILASFIIATLLSIFLVRDSHYIFIISNTLYKLDVIRGLFIFVFTLFIISCMATYDIINGLFEIFKFKYDISNRPNS